MCSELVVAHTYSQYVGLGQRKQDLVLESDGPAEGLWRRNGGIGSAERQDKVVKCGGGVKVEVGLEVKVRVRVRAIVSTFHVNIPMHSQYLGEIQE